MLYEIIILELLQVAYTNTKRYKKYEPFSFKKF